MIRQVILDTNFLLLPFELNIDILREFERILEINFEPIVLDEVFKELDNLQEKNKGKILVNIKNALEFSKRFRKVKFILEKNEKVDDLIIRYALKNSSIVATNDKLLKKRLREKNIPIIFTRKKKYLKLEGML